uniref:Uncharacterized protein ORF103_2 n=1 Tax=Phaeoceros laevis TaxID=37308 RepID=D3J0J7_9EMBR|nr:hypothetical protein PhlaMp27 [Phaeoceros laevis]ACT75311.1 hypothetical protein PhlaMp27 [Phaeoceros laevis]
MLSWETKMNPQCFSFFGLRLLLIQCGPCSEKRASGGRRSWLSPGTQRRSCLLFASSEKNKLNLVLADMMESVDMPGLGSGDFDVHGGSSPSIRTNWNLKLCHH